MRPIPEGLGQFTAREVFLVNCIRDLEQRVARTEVVLRLDNEKLAQAVAAGIAGVVDASS